MHDLVAGTGVRWRALTLVTATWNVVSEMACAVLFENRAISCSVASAGDGRETAKVRLMAELTTTTSPELGKSVGSGSDDANAHSSVSPEVPLLVEGAGPGFGGAGDCR